MPEITLPKSKSIKNSNKTSSDRPQLKPQTPVQTMQPQPEPQVQQVPQVQQQPTQVQQPQVQQQATQQPVTPQNSFGGGGGGFGQNWEDPFSGGGQVPGWGGGAGGGAGGGGFGGGGWNNDPWSDPWGAPSDNGAQEKKLTPQERVKMIEDVYEGVLGRKPDTRDINYYKYSTLSENEIRKQLLEGKEHKQLAEDGREFKKVKARAEQSETRVKMLEGQIHDQVEEFKQLTQLLNEKNRYIQHLRSQSGNAFSNSSASYLSSYRQTPVANVSYEPVEVVESFQQSPITEEPQGQVELGSFAQMAQDEPDSLQFEQPDAQPQYEPIEEAEVVQTEEIIEQAYVEPVAHFSPDGEAPQATFSSPYPQTAKASVPASRGSNPADQIISKIRSIFSV